MNCKTIKGPPERELGTGRGSISPQFIPDLVGYWRMEEALWDGTVDEVVDSSGMGNHGVAVNGVTTVAGGKIGRGGEFVAASSQYIDLGSPIIFAADGEPWTIATWSNPNPAITGTNDGWFAKGAGVAPFARFLTSSVLSYRSSGGTYYTLADMIPDGGMHLWVLTCDASRVLKPYRDAVAKTTKNLDNSQFEIRGVGSLLNLANAFMEGIIDEVAIWNRALAPSEIEFLYRGGAGRILR